MADDDEMLPEAQIFHNRAKMFPKKCSEEFEKMLKQAMKERESNSKTGEATKDTKLVVPRRTKRENLRKTKRKIIEEKNELPSLEIAEDFSERKAKLPARAKRLLDNLEKQKAKEKKWLEAENQRVLSSCHSFEVYDLDVLPVEDDCAANIETILKISYSSEIFKISCNKNERFASIYSKVADMLKLKASEILLCFKDENIQMNDTPVSLNLRICDVIECIPYKPEEYAETNFDKNKIQVKIQSSDCRRRVEMYFHKLDKMQEIMDRYSRLREIPLENLIFEFDGEKVDGSETLEELEMESGSCLDVKVIGDSDIVRSSKRSSPIVVDIDEDSINVIELD